jgi:hypothetical protein
MHDDAGAWLAIRRAEARVADLMEQVARDVVATSAEAGLTAVHDGLDMPLILYGIKQLSLDPYGFLRLTRRADEAETRATARLYTAIADGWDWAVSEVRAMAEELGADESWQVWIAPHVAAMQATQPDSVGRLPPAQVKPGQHRLCWLMRGD